MPIKNYSTKIPSSQTVGEMQSILAENGAERVMMEYNSGKVEAINFVMNVGDTPIQFRLVVEPEMLLRAMKDDKKIPRSACTIEQAERTAWRNKKEWLHLQMTEIATGQARLDQLLLGYAVTNTGETFYERLQQSGANLLTESKPCQ